MIQKLHTASQNLVQMYAEMETLYKRCLERDKNQVLPVIKEEEQKLPKRASQNEVGDFLDFHFDFS